MMIRELTDEDVPHLLKLLKSLDTETDFMLYEPDERDVDCDEDKHRLRQLITDNHSAVLGAEASGKLIGFCMVIGSRLRRIHHRASVVIGVLEAWHGKGVASQLLDEAERWARDQGVGRMELTVMAHNRRALGLYDKKGYRIEGTRKQAIRLGENYVDEFYMGKLINLN